MIKGTAKTVRILLFEDNPGDVRLIREMLSEIPGEGYTLDAVSGLAEGLNYLAGAQGEVDVVLLDLSLPDSSGLDTLLKVRDASPTTPIVVLTVLDDEDFGLQAVQSGAQDYLVKGQVDNRSLLRAVRYAIEREQARRERSDLLARERASQVEVEAALGKMQDLYEVSRFLSGAHQPDEVLRILVSSKYLRAIHQAYLLVFDQPWTVRPPKDYEVLAVLDSDSWSPGPVKSCQPMSSYPFDVLCRPDFPVFIEDAFTDPRLSEQARQLAAAIGTCSLMSFPLIAGGSWYGICVFHAQARYIWTPEISRHLHSLVDETAAVIDNIRLFAAEASARRRAELADSLKLKFLGMISHELRTPLTSIKGFTTTLLADDVTFDAHSQREFLNIINEEADKLTELIEQLLDLSRLQFGAFRVEPHPQTMDDILASNKAQIEALGANHRLVLEVEENLPTVMADIKRTDQVLANLINNAVKYTPEHSTVTIRAYREDNSVRVDVSDEGIGIPPEDRERVFESFQQVERKHPGQNKGAGLGLAICKAIVETHGGRIWIDDRSSPGTTVSFTLPVTVKS